MHFSRTKAPNWRAEVFKLPHSFRRPCGHDEISPVLKPPPAGDGPIQDAGQLGQQPIEQPMILATIEAVAQDQHNEPAGKSAARIVCSASSMP
jgi:hypothetical protein